MNLVIDSKGTIRCLYAEDLDLNVLGNLKIRRASQVEPDSQGRWWADLAPISGPKLGPFEKRSEALNAECSWLESKLAGGK